ncbi:MAG: hypothetical protein M5U26_21485 [Planctomycetota bacterium]|nr:hypothetical protein [Planctomycetota bacterium]
MRAGIGLTIALNTTAGGAMQVGGPAGRLLASNLVLTGTGAFTLDNPGNMVGVIAADLTASPGSNLTLRTSTNLFVGTVGAVIGIRTMGGDVTLLAPNGFISVDNQINTGAGPPGTATLTGDIRPANPPLTGSGDITLTAGVPPGGGAGTSTTFTLNPFMPMGPGPGFGLGDIGGSSFIDEDLLNKELEQSLVNLDLDIGEDINLPPELLKALDAIRDAGSSGNIDDSLRNSLEEFKFSETGLKDGGRALEDAAQVLKTMAQDEVLQELMKGLSGEVRGSSKEVREANVRLAKLIASLYASGAPDRVGRDALEGALKGLQQSNERLLLAARALAAAVERLKASGAALDLQTVKSAVEQAREEAARASAEKRDRQDRIGGDAKFANLEEYKEKDAKAKPQPAKP